jgi:hypothetical protein
MTKQIYKTAQGQTVDMGALRLQNEQVRAVGNMKVNARGDLLDVSGNVISSRTEQVNSEYNKQIKNNQGQ